MKRSEYLSKSRMMAGAQCVKRLWLQTRRPELDEISSGTEAVFTIGHEVGAAAQRLWPEGHLIGHDNDLSQALAETKVCLEQATVTLFEATFNADGILVRTDIFNRDEADNVWLIEVKASTSVKEHYFLDCAIQYQVLKGAGHEPATVTLAHINNQFIYTTLDNYEGLFELEDVTKDTVEIADTVEPLAAKLRSHLVGSEPEIAVGPHCSQPYECPFLTYCSPSSPEYPVEALPGGKKVVQELLNEGIEDIRNIPAGRLTNDLQERIREITVSGKPQLLTTARDALEKLPYPRYYFDFETVSFAVPIWLGTRPYQALPFQWSCHIESASGELEHREYLPDEIEPPMRNVAETLIEALGNAGPIIVYTAYEKRMINLLIEMHPDLKTPLKAITERIFDLHPITKNNYYHPDMLGSWSLKSVMPTVAADVDYSALQEIQDGGAADAAFKEMLNSETTQTRRAQIRKSLFAYCQLDTLALVRLTHFLSRDSSLAPAS